MFDFPIEQNDRYTELVAAAGQVLFNSDFPIYTKEEAKVVRVRAGVSTPLVLDTDYAVSNIGVQAGFTITLTVAAQAGDILQLAGATKFERLSDYPTGQALSSEALNADFDRAVMRDQELQRDLDILSEQVEQTTGDVTGPATAGDNRIAVFDGTTGKVIKDGGKTITELDQAIETAQTAADQAQATADAAQATANAAGDVDGPAAAVADRIAVFNGTTGKLIKDGGKAIAELAQLDSPVFTGNPTAPTPAAGDNDTSLATTAFVQTALVPYMPKTGGAFSGGISAPFVTANAGALMLDRAGDGTNSTMINRGDQGFNRDLQFQTGTSARFILRVNAVAEGGANAGSNLSLLAYDDAGASLGSVFDVARATRILNFLASPTGPTPAAGDNSSKLATTAFVQAAAGGGGGGSGDVVGPAGAVAERIAVFDGATGKLIKDGGQSIAEIATINHPPSLAEADSSNVFAGAQSFVALRFDATGPHAPARYTQVGTLPAHALSKTINGVPYAIAEPVLHAKMAGLRADHVAGTGTWANHPIKTAFAGTTDDTQAFKRLVDFAKVTQTPIELPLGGTRIVETSGVTPFDVPNVETGQYFNMRGHGKRSYILLDGPFTDYFLKIHQTGQVPEMGPGAAFKVPHTVGSVVLEDISVIGAGYDETTSPPTANVAQKGILFQKAPHIEGMRLNRVGFYGIPGTALCLGGETDNIYRETSFEHLFFHGCGSFDQPAILLGSGYGGGANNYRFYELTCRWSRFVGLSIQAMTTVAQECLMDYVRLENCWGPAMELRGAVSSAQFRFVKINSAPMTSENANLPYLQFLQGNQHSGTAQAGSLSTITLAASASAEPNKYVDDWISLRSGAGVGQAAKIAAYDSVTKVTTIYGAWVIPPDSTTQYQIGGYGQHVSWQGHIEGVESGILLEGGSDVTLEFECVVRDNKVLKIGPGVYGAVYANWVGFNKGYWECDAKSSLYVRGTLPTFFTAKRLSWIRYERTSRTTDLARANTAALAKDDDLIITVPAANTKYLFRWYVMFWAPAAAGIKFSIFNAGTTVSASTTYRYRAPGATSVSADVTIASLPSGASPISVVGSSDGRGFAEFEVTIEIGTADQLRLNWAQNAANVSPTVVMMESKGEMLRLA